MKTLQNIIATLALATAAGCSSAPSWPEPKVRDQPIYVAASVSEQPTETEQPADTSKLYKFTFGYPQFQNKIESGLFQGLVQLAEKKENRELSKLDKIELARKIGGDDGVNSDELNAHAKQTGEKIPFIYNASVDLTYIRMIDLDKSQAKRIEALAGTTLEEHIKLAREIEKVDTGSKIGKDEVDQLEYSLTGKMPGKKPEQPKQPEKPKEPGEQNEKPVPQPGNPEQPESGYVKKTLIENYVIADKNDGFKRRNFYSICAAVNRTDHIDVAYEMDGLGNKDGEVGFEEHSKFLALNNLKNFSRLKDTPEAANVTKQTEFTVEKSASKAYDNLMNSLKMYDQTRFRRIAEKLYGANPALDSERIKELAKELK